MAEIKNRATLDSTQFQAGLKSMQGQVKGLAGSLKSLPGIGGALTVAGLSAAAMQAMKTADEIDNLAVQMGMGVETVQAYKVALGEAGLGMGDLQAASDKLTKAQAEAIQGNQKARASFAALGIDMGKLQGADTTRLLELVGQGLKSTEGDAAATSAQFDLLGRGSERLRGVLIELNKDGIEAQIQSMKELGLVIDAEMIQRLDAAELRVSRFTTRTKGWFAGMTADAIQGFEMMGKMIGGMSASEAFDATNAPLADARAAQEERRAREQERRMQGVETQAQGELAALEEKRRLASLTNEELRAELTNRLELVRAEFAAADGTLARLEALKEINSLEEQIGRIRDERQPSERRNTSMFERLGTVSPNGGTAGKSRLELQAEKHSELYRRMLTTQQSQLDVLRDIASERGAVL
jgi:hypothetical protein